MPELTQEERDHLDEKFNEFKKSLWAKAKIPSIGLAVVFASLISIFASYMYISARSDVAQAQVDFYQNLLDTQHEISDLKEQMITNFNEFIEDISQQKKKLDQIIETEELIQKQRIEADNSFIGPPTPRDELAEEFEDKLKEYEERLEQTEQYKIDVKQFKRK